MHNAEKQINRHRGFTLVELLVVIAIIAVLISVLLPALKKAQEAAWRINCAAGARSLTMAWTAYAEDNKGALVDAWPDRGPSSKQRPWMLGLAWGNKYGNTEAALKEGALYKYLNSVKVYHCAGDFGWHLNSYSINAFLNGEGTQNGKPLIVYNRAQVKHPSEVFVFIENNDIRPQGSVQMSYNLGSFMVPRHGDAWNDPPGMWHNRGANISFADGHVIYRHWDARATQNMRDDAFGTSTPNNGDLKWLQSVTGGE